MSILVQLPDAAQSFIDEQVATGCFSSASDFIVDLVEQARRKTAIERVDRLLLEGLDSGPPVKVDRDWWLRKSDEWANKHGGASPS